MLCLARKPRNQSSQRWLFSHFFFTNSHRWYQPIRTPMARAGASSNFLIDMTCELVFWHERSRILFDRELPCAQGTGSIGVMRTALQARETRTRGIWLQEDQGLCSTYPVSAHRVFVSRHKWVVFLLPLHLSRHFSDGVRGHRGLVSYVNFSKRRPTVQTTAVDHQNNELHFT